MATPTLAPDSSGKRPLAVSLERTLLRNSLWLDLFFTARGRNGADGPKALLWLLGGAGDGRRRLSQAVALDPATLPYDQAVLARIRAAKAEGRAILLVSEADEALARVVADRLGLFDDVFAAGARAGCRTAGARVHGPSGTGRLDAASAPASLAEEPAGRGAACDRAPVHARCRTSHAACLRRILDLRLLRLCPQRHDRCRGRPTAAAPLDAESAVRPQRPSADPPRERSRAIARVQRRARRR